MAATVNFAVRGDRSSPRGRSLHATKNFQAGDTIAVFTNPSIVLPTIKAYKTTCGYCLSADLPVSLCSGCRVVPYCGSACQSADWKLIHKKECRVCRKVREMGHDLLPTPVRALVQILLQPKLRKIFEETLEGNVQAWQANEEAWQDFMLQSRAALVYVGHEVSEVSLKAVATLLCQVR
jgi:SET and MYND domain-containing protein